MGALTFYRYEQPIVDYCQAHQPLRLNMGFEGPPQGLEDLGPCERGQIQTVALPAVPSAASIGASMPRPCSPPPPLRPSEGPSSGPFPIAERTGTLKFGR
ncbi:leucine-rich repeat transmembrane neuronal protein 4-like [Solea senegalensis]|uniref:Leucine-rich repeat transmembrane neuronal protein 4-like n=1 Tax=Solea senegalensis TaxID=28829 RepID=A0AAV6R3J3_SOLSE|nr:leucine-rich repeat transmembrane neuronal protein 4-like [Solea senegalensis]